MSTSLYHIIVYTPQSSADAVRQAIATAGGGQVGNYDSCSFSTPGTGRFRPLDGAAPAIGQIDQLETVDEERIEAMVTAANIQAVLQAVCAVHPYEEPAIHVLPMTDYHSLL